MKIKKFLSVVLATSMLLGSVPLWGGKAEAADSYKVTVNNNPIQSVEYGTIAAKKDGNYTAWGYGFDHGYDGFSYLGPQGVGMIYNKIELMAVDDDTVYVQDDLGDIYTWGATWNDLGDSSYTPSKYPITFEPLHDVDDIYTSSRSGVAEKDGEVYVWGMNRNNVLGVIGKQYTPVKLTLPEKVLKVTLNKSNLIVLLESGTLGYMASDGSGFVSVVSDVKDVWTNGGIVVLLDKQGNLRKTSSAKLANFVTITNTPTDIKQISVGVDHLLVLRENGEVWSNGANDRQQLGTSTTTLPNTELIKANRVPKDVVHVSAGYKSNFVRTINGDTYGWGWNNKANIGTGMAVDQNFGSNIGSPVLIPALKDFYSVPVVNTKLPAPINLTTNVVNKTSLVVSFNPVAGADKYTIVINGKIAYTSNEDTSKIFYDMLPNTTYVVEVYASKDGVDGERATSSSTTPEAETKLEAPGQLTVVSTEAGNVKVSWNATNGALLYKVLRNGVEVGSVSNPSYTDKNAIEGEAYLYSVKSFDGVKNSDPSPFVLVNVTGKVEVPKAPSNPTNFRVVSDEHSVTASWEAAVGADTYQVVINGLEVYNGSELSYTYSGLPEKTEYRVEISAVNSVGKSGSQLMTIWTKDPLKLPAAKNPRAETTHNEAVISWDAVDGATGYWVRINNDVVYEGPDTTVTAKGLGSDRPYTVYIFAKNDKVEGEPATLSIVTKKEPVVLDKPANLVASPKATYIKLTWDVVAGATEYIVKQGQAIVYQGKLTTFTQTDLPNGATYNYEVIAVKGDAESEPAIVSATTLVAQLPYPANFRVTDLAWNNIRLDWDELEGADEYLITRDGMSIGVPQNTGWSEGSDSIWPGATYTYKVAAYKDGVLGKTAQKVVTIPAEPVVGQAPTGDLVIKANRVEHNRVGLSWSTVTGATYYDVYQDDTNKVWTGSLNTITDPNVGPQEQHTYKVVASNEWGTLDSNVIEVTTPAAPQSIVITPSQPMEGTITFDFKVIDGAVTYVERNPQTTYTPLGDGSYQKTYYNSATDERRDEGIVTPVNGKLNFSETGVDPSKNYHYDIVAVVKKADGTEEVVAKEEVSVNTPADGTGATVPGTIVDPGNGGGATPIDPGTGGGNTPTPNPGTGNGGDTTPTNPPTPGTGGSVTNPSTGGSAPSNTNGGTVTVPGTVGGTDTEVITEEETEQTTSPSFTDVEGSFAKEAILSLSSKGIVKGYSDGTFGGKKKVTRAEFAIFINRALGYSSFSSYLGTFADFNPEAWYATELNSALQNGITKGFNDNTYRPNAFISREQAAIMLSNVLLNNGAVLSSTGQYEDYDSIVSWATESVDLVTQESVMGGYPGNKFLPKRELTREEAAQLIYNLIKS
ncbi:MAG: S-layer homology domain-containing protein [Candidatus Pristimantibacillus sp.]